MRDYVHGYDGVEGARLVDQARTLEDLLHGGLAYPPGSAVLEVGCGVGAQTVALVRRSPGARFTAVEIDREAQQILTDEVTVDVDFNARYDNSCCGFNLIPTATRVRVTKTPR